MTTVRVFELAGDGAPALRLADVELDQLEAELRARPGDVTRLLLLEVGANAPLLPGLAGLQRRAVKLLVDLRLEMPLAPHVTTHLHVTRELTRGQREITSVMDTLNAHAMVNAHAVIADVTVASGSKRPLAIFETWIEELGVGDVAAKHLADRPPPQPAALQQRATDILAELLHSDRCLDSTAVGQALLGGRLHSNPKMVASRQRKAGAILGVWDGNGFRYPSFQFHPYGHPDAGRVRPEVAALIAELPRDADGSGRDAALWLFAPDAALDGRTPAEVFPEDPDRVITLARQRRGGDDAVE